MTPLADLETYRTTGDFYDAHPRARRSAESDFGVWWRDEEGGTWRVSYVHATGHVYAVPATGRRTSVVRIGERTLVVDPPPVPTTDGPIVVFGRLEATDEQFAPAPESVDRALDGWAEKCGSPGSLAWILGRVESAAERNRTEPEPRKD